MTDLLFHAVFASSKVGKTGLTPTVDIDKVERSTGTRTAVATGAAATEMRNGHYSYRLAGVTDLHLYDYVACFKTADSTVDMQHIHSYWGPYPLAYATELARLDAAISSRHPAGAAVASVTDPVTVGSLLTAALQQFFTTNTGLEWDDADALSVIRQILAGVPPIVLSQGDPLNSLVPGAYPAGSAGEALGIALRRLGAGAVEFVAPTDPSGNVYTIQGDRYPATLGRSIKWHGYGIWPTDMTGATVTAIVNNSIEIDCLVTVASGEGQEVTCEPAGAETADIPVGKHLLQVKAWFAGDDDPVTLVNGWWVSSPAAGVPA